MRDRYLIVRLDHVLVPTAIAYVGHGETPYDLNLRFTYWRSSATEYSNKRDAIREARRIARNMPRYQFKVNGCGSRQTVWTNRNV